MIGQALKRLPAKYQFLGFLVITSLIGVFLILVAVYNASKELELLHEIENLHRFATAQLKNTPPEASNHQRLLALAAPNYQILIIEDDKIVANSRSITGSGWTITPDLLRESHLHQHGGYLELNDLVLTWAKVPLDNKKEQLLILHRFTSSGFATLKQAYLKRLLIPAIFYIWLMVWMAFILRFLTDKLSRQKQEMEKMAMTDSLTGLPNRNLLAERLDTMLQIAKRKNEHFALAMIDLDGFKKVNDSLGHAIGDALLEEIAGRLNTCLRAQDTVARVGGDEFILLLDDTEEQSSLEICERVAVAISKPILIQDLEVNVGSSIGIAQFPEHGEDPETLTRNADHTMYEVKSGGGGIRMYGDELRTTTPEPLNPT